MKILIASSEIFPLAKTGGLADAVAGLSRALKESGTTVAVVTPAYRATLERFPAEETGIEAVAPAGKGQVHGAVLKTEIPGGVPVYLIRNDDFFSREGLYGTSKGDYPDNAGRFSFFCRAALDLASKTGPWDVIHAHDWQSALIPVYLKAAGPHQPARPVPKTVFTIHNLAYQGLFPSSAWEHLNLDRSYFSPRYLEFYGQVNFLKAAILFADALTTVSRRYAEEIRTPEYGCGLEGVLAEKGKSLRGILNGADYRQWSPETDPHIKANYGRDHPDGKAICKGDLQGLFGLRPEPSVPVVAMISRLVDHKGLDLVRACLGELLALDLQIVILGTGHPAYEKELSEHARESGKLGVRIGFDEALAHKMQAGADMLLMPSRYEPCGLNQIYGLRYGTIPIVHATGGLDDTIEDFNPFSGRGNGFKFRGYARGTLVEAVKRALAVHSHAAGWRRLMANAMAEDFSWARSAREYLLVYQGLIADQSPAPGSAPAL